MISVVVLHWQVRRALFCSFFYRFDLLAVSIRKGVFDYRITGLIVFTAETHCWYHSQRGIFWAFQNEICSTQRFHFAVWERNEKTILMVLSPVTMILLHSVASFQNCLQISDSSLSLLWQRNQRWIIIFELILYCIQMLTWAVSSVTDPWLFVRIWKRREESFG